ncbi:MAG: VWA domain-containing protein [Pyrinomonadaceae bacterium]|nr:VWA domain-containing protein [Pyrinomonadaceae bacterium]
MMKQSIRVFSLLATVLLYVLTFSVQSQQQDVERVEIRRVHLPVTVLDKKGNPVIGLKSSDFMIFEDKKPQQIETFSDENDPSQPLYIGVLMDTSPSAIAKLKFEQEAAMNFLRSVLRPRKDRAALVTFDDEVILRQDFTDKIDLLERAIAGLKKPGKQTALYDAAWGFCNDKLRNAPGRRAIVVITDGDDTYSRALLKDVIEVAQQTETTVFAVSTKAGFAGTVPGVDAGQAPDDGDRGLMRLGEETGGRAFFTGDPLQLEQAFDKVARELRAQYLVTYKPTNERYDGNFRRIEVKLVTARDGLKLRAKRGYVASAQTGKGR